MNDHDNHQTMEREIAELSALERMRKRAADDDSTSLRNIYLEETRQSTELSSIGYVAIESSIQTATSSPTKFTVVTRCCR